MMSCRRFVPKRIVSTNKPQRFGRDVIDDLSSTLNGCRQIFYDAAGSELFEQITLLPEYYPTRSELSILLMQHAISAIVPEGAALVEFGAGATTKVRLLVTMRLQGLSFP